MTWCGSLGRSRASGVDAMLGLVPGFGDLLGSGISGAIMFDAVRARVPVPVLAQMAWNLADALEVSLLPPVVQAMLALARGK